MSRVKWNLESVHKEAMKYVKRSDFNEGCRGAYAWANKNGVLGYVCGHMRPIPNIVDCVDAFLDYDKITHCRYAGNEAKYRWALRNGIVPLLQKALK